jgi:small subunit ribosomal protein S19
MSRAKWKGPYINSLNFKEITAIKKQYVYLISRSSEIIPKFLGLTFKVHNGKSYSDVTVNDSMIGHKFGEFVFTRAEFAFKKKKSKK